MVWYGMVNCAGMAYGIITLLLTTTAYSEKFDGSRLPYSPFLFTAQARRLQPTTDLTLMPNCFDLSLLMG